MGKVKVKRFKAPKPTPTGEIIQETDLEEEFDGDGDFISYVTTQLQGKKAEAKCCACNKLSALNDVARINEVLESDITRIVAPMMMDRNRLLQHTAVGALRNLSVAGGQDACEKLVESDLMTPLVHLFKKYGTDWSLNKSCLEKKHLDSEGDTFLQACYLLFNLSESSGICIKIFNSEKLLPIFIRCLNYEEFSTKIAIAVAHCLHVISEDNFQFSSDVEEWCGTLHKLLEVEDCSPDLLLLRILIIGILLNIENGNIDKFCGRRLEVSMKVLSECLSVDTCVTLGASLTKIESLDDSKPEDDDLTSDVDNILSAQQVALEILTNICSSSDEDMDSSFSSTSDEMHGFTIDTRGDHAMDCEESTFISFPGHIEEALLSVGMVKKVISKLEPVDESLISKLKGHDSMKHLAARLELITCRALSCFHNMIMTLNADDVGDMHTLWLSLGQLVFREAGTHSLVFLESATSVLRALLEKLVNSQKCDQLEKITVQDLQRISQSGLKCEESSVRVNIVRILGILGSQFALNKNSAFDEHLKCIGVLLLLSCQDVDVWVVGESLDCCIDVFSEDQTDGVAKSVGLVEKLNSISPQFIHKMKIQRKQVSADRNAFLVTVKTNLKRFLQYKSSQNQIKVEQ